MERRKSTMRVSMRAVAEWLETNNLDQLLHGVTALGVGALHDLHFVETDDLDLLQMKSLQKRRFQRAVAEVTPLDLETVNTSSVGDLLVSLGLQIYQRHMDQPVCCIDMLYVCLLNSP
jgi:hypothetical protein